MAKRGKKYLQTSSKVQKGQTLSLQDGVKLVKKLNYTKFPGSIELHLKIQLPKGVDPKSIKANIALPYMEAKDIKIAVAVPEDLANTAKEAGADIYRLDEIINNVKKGKINFDILLAVPQVMPKLASLGKELGPKGLMPNPKSGTVIKPEEIKTAVTEFKKGKLVFKADNAGGIHVAVGKINYDDEKIIANIKAIIDKMVSILGKSKEYIIQAVYLAPTMGPAVKIDIKSI